MIFGLFRKNSRNQEIVERQYAVLTAAARQPELYRSFGVPDTVIGRFEMLSTILILYFRRTQKASESAKELAQNIVEAFFEDIDHSIRELGISDHGVPKRMKKFASMFYGRGDSYGRALDSGDLAELEAALKRNFHPENAESALSMQNLAHYMLDIEKALNAVPDDVVARGEITIAGPKQEGQT